MSLNKPYIPKGKREKHLLRGGPYDGMRVLMYSPGTLEFSLKRMERRVRGTVLTEEREVHYKGYYDYTNQWVSTLTT